MEAYYLSITAWVPDKRDPETQTIKLTGYHSTQDGTLREFHNKFGKKITFSQLSKRLKASIPDTILDKPNKIQVETIHIEED